MPRTTSSKTLRVSSFTCDHFAHMQVKVISCAVAATVHIRVGSRCNRQAVEIAMLGSGPMAARAGVEDGHTRRHSVYEAHLELAYKCAGEHRAEISPPRVFAFAVNLQAARRSVEQEKGRQMGQLSCCL